MRKDDDVEIPSMMLDQDEVNERRALQEMSKKKPHTHSVKEEPVAPQPTMHIEEKEESSSPSLFGVYALLAVTLCVFAGVIYMMWSQNQSLKAELQTQISDLDSQLIAVDESASKQGLTIEETLKFHESEIRKLWGVSYDTNRKSIKGNTDSVASLKKEMASFTTSVSQHTKQMASLESSQKKLSDTTTKDVKSLQDSQSTMQKTLSTVTGSTTVLESQLDSQAEQVEDLLKSVADINSDKIENAARIKQAEETLREMAASLDDLQRKVTEQLGSISSADLEIQLADHKEAIDSIDAYRIQVNNKLNRLEANVNQLLLDKELN